MTGFSAPNVSSLRRPAAFLGLLAGVPLLVLVVASGRGRVQPILVLVLLGAVAAALVVRRYPLAAVATAVTLGALIPYYDGRYVTRGLAITPVAALCLALLPAALEQLRGAQLTVLDLAVAAYLVVLVVSRLVNYSRGPGAAAAILLSDALPYVVGRGLVRSRPVLGAVALATVAVGTVLSVFALAEHAGTPNPFFTWVSPTFQAGQWAHAETRLGSVRAEASFGHPGAFGLYLVAVLALSLALALTARTAGRQLVLFGATGVVAAGLVATLSRGPIAAAVVACGVVLAAAVGRVAVTRLVLVSILVLGLSVGTGVTATLSELRASSTTEDSREALSAQYRLRILDTVLDPSQFSLLGKSAAVTPDGEQAGSLSELTNERTNLKSVDSEYGLTYLTSGLFALLTLLLVGCILVRWSFLRGLDLLERAWVVGSAVVAVDILTVSLQTQQAELWWFGTAVVAGIVHRRRTRLS